MIITIVGRTGTGKDTLANILAEKGLRILKSYTTRPQRTPDEDTHIFINPEDVDKYPNKVATTNINGYDYFATAEQLEECDVYIIDPNGLTELAKNSPDTAFLTVYMQAAPQERRFHAVQRVPLKDKIKEEEVFVKRSDSENEQFSEFEDIVTSYENNLQALPENIINMVSYYNHYDENDMRTFANSLADYVYVFRGYKHIIDFLIQNDKSDLPMIKQDGNRIYVRSSDNTYTDKYAVDLFIAKGAIAVPDLGAGICEYYFTLTQGKF